MGEVEQSETSRQDHEFPDRTRDKQLWRTGKQVDRRVCAQRYHSYGDQANRKQKCRTYPCDEARRNLPSTKEPLYDRYRKSNDKEKFLRGHESEIILFEAAARELKRLGTVPLPTTESMKTELANLNAEKERLLAEYKAARAEAQEYETVKQNVDALLTVAKEQEQQRRHELE